MLVSILDLCCSSMGEIEAHDIVWQDHFGDWLAVCTGHILRCVRHSTEVCDLYNYAHVQWQRSHSHLQAVNSTILGVVWSKYDANKPSHMQDPCLWHKESCNLGVVVWFRLSF